MVLCLSVAALAQSSAQVSNYASGLDRLAPDSQARITGGPFCDGILAGNFSRPSYDLLGVRVYVDGVQARLTGVEPDVIAFIVPRPPLRRVSSGRIRIETIYGVHTAEAGLARIAPGIYLSHQDRRTPYAIIRWGKDMPTLINPGQPVYFGASGYPSMVGLFTTGVRNAKPEELSVVVGGIYLPVSDVGPFAGLIGYDLVAFEVPEWLKNYVRGEQEVRVVWAGGASNPCYLFFASAFNE